MQSSLVLAFATDGTAPEWVRVFPAGTTTAADGRGPWTLANPDAVIAASMAAGKLPIDVNHATDLAAKNGQPSPAVGWIVEMANREDGIWGRVEWTAPGQQLFADKAYRAISPVFTTDPKTRKVLCIRRAALTNDPAMPELTLSHAETTMDLTPFRQALGLAETADEAAILAAITASRATLAAHSATSEQVTTLAATVRTLETELASLRTSGARARAEAAVDAAIRAGKPVNALREHYIARHLADAASVETELAAMPSINAGGVTLAAMGDDGLPTMTSAERDIAAKFGHDPKKVAAFKKKQAEMQGGNA